MHTSRLPVRLLSLLFGAALLLSATVAPLHAEDIDLGALAQNQFNLLVRDLGTAFSYVPARTPEHSGLTGFRVGVGVTAAEIPDDRTYVQQAFRNNDAPSFLYLPRLDAQKGLPFGFEAIGFVSGDPDGNARLFGGALQYNILEGSVVSPALAVRAHGSQLFNVDELDLRTYGGDISISKGFTFITPYAGYSYFAIEGEEDAGLGLNDHDTEEDRIFGGARFSGGWLTLTAQVDIANEVNLYTLNGAFHF